MSEATPERNTIEATMLLARRLQARDPAAGAELAERFRESLLRFCWGYLGSTDQAEDAVQDIFCKVAAAETIPELFRPWLYKVARNHCLTLRRNRAARKDNRPLPAASQVFHALTGNLTRLAREEAQDQLIEFAHSLPEDQREMLRLRYVEGLSRAEIAEVLEVGESTVKARLFDAMQVLRRHAVGLMGP